MGDRFGPEYAPGSLKALAYALFHKELSRAEVSCLPKSQQEVWRRKAQWAYEQPTYEAVQAELTRVHRELRLIAPARCIRGAGPEPEDDEPSGVDLCPGRAADG
jgi:hypothetical protein